MLLYTLLQKRQSLFLHTKVFDENGEQSDLSYTTVTGQIKCVYVRIIV